MSSQQPVIALLRSAGSGRVKCLLCDWSDDRDARCCCFFKLQVKKGPLRDKGREFVIRGVALFERQDC